MRIHISVEMHTSSAARLTFFSSYNLANIGRFIPIGHERQIQIALFSVGDPMGITLRRSRVIKGIRTNLQRHTLHTVGFFNAFTRSLLARNAPERSRATGVFSWVMVERRSAQKAGLGILKAKSRIPANRTIRVGSLSSPDILMASFLPLSSTPAARTSADCRKRLWGRCQGSHLLP